MPRGGRADGVAGGEGVRALLLLMAVWARSPSLGVTWELTLSKAVSRFQRQSLLDSQQDGLTSPRVRGPRLELGSTISFSESSKGPESSSSGYVCVCQLLGDRGTETRS